MKQYQVIIVGGGPAGAACAGRLIQSGVDCLILDKQSFPRSKTCAGWITPQVFRDLNQTPKEYPHPLTRFNYLKVAINGFPLIKPGRQYAIRREEFDHWLLEKSQSPIVQHDVKEILVNSDGYQIDGLYRAKYLVGAGGTHCPVYHHFFKDQLPRSGERIVALEKEFQTTLLSRVCQLWFLEKGLPGYAWYVPKANSYLNIGIGGNERVLKEREAGIKDHWNFFINKLQKKKLLEQKVYQPDGYIYYLRSRADRYRKGNAYLVGDSAGLATLDMGEGIGPAVQSGLIAAHSIINNTEYSLESIARYSFLPFFLRWVMG